VWQQYGFNNVQAVGTKLKNDASYLGEVKNCFKQTTKNGDCGGGNFSKQFVKAILLKTAMTSVFQNGHDDQLQLKELANGK
jgi:hypothetical protein